LLFAVAPERLDALLARAAAMGQPLWVVGDVVSGAGLSVSA
jgi:hypothetical protein